MTRVHWLAPLSALILAGCGNSQSVDRPAAEVYMTLLSLPSDASAVSLATSYPGTSSYVEPAAGKVIWHFMRDGSGEYGRYVAEVEESGAAKSTVTTYFEDGPADSNLPFLDKVAQIALDASVTAALQQKPVDRSAVQSQIARQMVSDPIAAQTAAIETVSDEMQRDAPPDTCKTGTAEERNSWVCKKHGTDINGDTGVVTDAETGQVIRH
jgi:hypothetical protein